MATRQMCITKSLQVLQTHANKNYSINYYLILNKYYYINNCHIINYCNIKGENWKTQENIEILLKHVIGNFGIFLTSLYENFLEKNN